MPKQSEKLKSGASGQRGLNIPIEPNCLIEIKDMITSFDLNGQKATVVRFDYMQQRWVVRLHSTGTGKAIRKENIKIL